MRVSIGVLAWNEENSIAGALESILSQSLLTDGCGGLVDHVEILCVPNGCTDQTEQRARAVLERSRPEMGGGGRRYEVHPVQKASKANAWNVFVHELSDSSADFLLMMDGDVCIEGAETLSNMIRALHADATAWVAGARTIKHIAARRTWNPKHLISLGASEIRRGMPGTFAGCLYCARAPVLRQFRLPSVLIGEDVFVRAMIVTDFFTAPDRPARVITAPEATVRFEAYTSLPQVFRNLKRRAITIAIDGIIFDRLWASSTPLCHGGQLLMQWDAEDPGWDERLIQSEVRRPRWRRSPTIHVRKWIARLGGTSVVRGFLLLPAALVAGILDGAAQHAANRSLRKGTIGRGWFVTQTRLG